MRARDAAAKSESITDRSPERGASAVEYALLIALVAAVIFAAVLGLGQVLPGLYQSVCPAFSCGE